MANTFTQIHIHAVFAVKYRRAMIQNDWKIDLYKYIAGILEQHTHKLLAINGMPDHLHVLFGMRPVQSLSDLMQDIKGSSSGWVNKQKLTKSKFEWQSGFGAFSYSKSQVERVRAYVANQEQHHKKLSFEEEYEGFLKKFGVDYDEQFIFQELQ